MSAPWTDDILRDPHVVEAMLRATAACFEGTDHAEGLCLALQLIGAAVELEVVVPRSLKLRVAAATDEELAATIPLSIDGRWHTHFVAGWHFIRFVQGRPPGEGLD